jgi:Mpv17 / PMP22 family
MMLHPPGQGSPRKLALLIALFWSLFGQQHHGVRCFQIQQHSRHHTRKNLCGGSSKSISSSCSSLFRRHNSIVVLVVSPISRSSRSRTSSSSSSTSTRLNNSYANVVQAIDVFWRTNPFAAAAIICGVKASAADYVAQRRQIKSKRNSNKIKKKNTSIVVAVGENENNNNAKADLRRNFAFILYGSLYQGMAQEFIYNHLYPVWFGTGTDPTTVLVKVVFDVTLQTTLVTLPIAYLAKALIFNYSWQEALARYTDDIQNHGLLKKYISLWFPVNCLTFSVVPEYLRVSWIAFVSFFWLIILSSIASRARVPTAPVVTVVSASNAIEIEAEAVVDANDDDEEEDEYCLLTDGTTCNIDG